MDSPTSKRRRTIEEDIVPGDQVRIVNLPSHPGLEGLTGTVVSTIVGENGVADVKLDKNQVVKRV